MKKYQGKEFRAVIQAPNETELDNLIKGMVDYSKKNKLGTVKILEKGQDPDGGWVGTISAHNWNPISWIKEKIGGKKKPLPEDIAEEGTIIETPAETGVQPEGSYTPMTGEQLSDSKQTLLQAGSPEKGWEYATEMRGQAEELKDKLAKEQEAREQAELARERISGHLAEWQAHGGEKGPKEKPEEYKERMFGSSEAGKVASPFWGQSPELTEEELKKLPRGRRKEYERMRKEAEASRTEAAFQVWREGAPQEITSYQRIRQLPYYTDKVTGKPVPEPRTAEERAAADYHQEEWVYTPLTRRLTPAEQLRVARAQEFEKMELDITREKYKQFKRERKPIYRVAKAAGGFGTFMAGAVTMGVAGMARGARPGKGGPERAMRMHAPGLPLDLYAVKPVLGVGMPSAKDLTGAGLGHLRELTLPGIRKTKKQVQQVRRSVEP